jgi:putative tryptophan/tyrosine transport system substrate-binding protein
MNSINKCQPGIREKLSMRSFRAICLSAGFFVLCFARWAFAETDIKVGLLISGTQTDAAFAEVQLSSALKPTAVQGKKTVSFITVISDNDLSKLPELARQIVNKNPRLLVASSQAAARALAETKTTIPVVFVSASNPVAEKLVSSMNRPGANITGIFDYLDLDPKLTETACRWLIENKRVLFIYFAGEKTQPDFNGINKAGVMLGCQVDFLAVLDFHDLKSKVLSRAQAGRFAVVMPMNFVFFKHSQEVIDFLNAEKIPAIYERTSNATNGGLLAFGPNQQHTWKHVARIANRILGGESPATIPVERNRDVEFVVNMKTAIQIGYRPPTALLLSADKVIEN